ncbi:MAG: hypothetical protein ACW981_08535 [Candidatus Hodarchaeales archaeon]
MKTLKPKISILFLSLVITSLFLNFSFENIPQSENIVPVENKESQSPLMLEEPSNKNNQNIDSNFNINSLNKAFDTLKNLPNYKQTSSNSVSNVSEYNVSDVLEFWVVDYGYLATTSGTEQDWVDSFYQTNATVKAISNHSVVFVEDGISYDETSAQGLANEFEANIWNSEVPYFGTVPDVDNNGKISIFIMDIEDGSTGGSYIAGVFLRIHQSDPNGHSSNEFEYYSMFMELVHIDIQSVLDNEVNGTLAHEFQHLIHFESDPDETLWIDEGASSYASYHAGYTSDISGYLSNSNPNYFLYDTDSSLTYWTQALRDYSAVFLFFLYLSNRFGPNVIGEIVNSTLKDQGSVMDILQNNYGYIGDFEDIFQDWTIANTLDLPGSLEYGYSSHDLNARIINNVNSFPTSFSGSVSYWGTDIYQINSLTDPSILEINFEEGNLGEYVVSTLVFSSEYGNWSIESFDSTEISGNFIDILITDFYTDKNSKVLLLISSTNLTSSDIFSIPDEDEIKKGFNVLINLTSVGISSDSLRIFYEQNNSIQLKNINVYDLFGIWNKSSIVHANYSILDANTDEIIPEFSNNLTFNEGASSYELVLNISSLDPGFYELMIFFSNGTTNKVRLYEFEVPNLLSSTISPSSSSTSSLEDTLTSISTEESSNGPIVTSTFGFDLISLFFGISMISSLILINRRRWK